MPRPPLDSRATKANPSPMLSARFERSMLKAIERWAKKNRVSKSEAIRRLIQAGLDATPPLEPSR